jgi:hypothetical protein
MKQRQTEQKSGKLTAMFWMNQVSIKAAAMLTALQFLMKEWVCHIMETKTQTVVKGPVEMS